MHAHRTKLILFLAILLSLSFFYADKSVFAQLNLSTPDMVAVANGPNVMVTIPLNLTNPSGTAVRAAGLTFFYPTSLLAYDTVSSAGTLTQGWIAVNGREVNPGEITIGGFNTTAATGPGVFLNVIFKVNANVSGCDSLRLRNFRDDLASATTTDGLCLVDSCRTTAVESHTTLALPTAFELLQNYPNPFNAGTQIRFALPKASRVTLTIYNVLGIKVKTLVDAAMRAGEHGTVWNGTDDHNRPVTSGVYFYRLKTEGFTAERRMLFVK